MVMSTQIVPLSLSLKCECLGLLLTISADGQSGLGGTGFCPPQEVTTVGVWDAEFSTVAFGRVLQPLTATCNRRGHMCSYHGYWHTRKSGWLMLSCKSPRSWFPAHF